MNPSHLRIPAAALLVGVVVLYSWLAWRGDPRIATTGLLPAPVAVYLDLKPILRNFPAFLLLAGLAATAVSGLGRRWQVVSLALCLAAPLVKDLAQDLFAPTRHFNWDATALGTLGAAVGWGAAALLLRRMRSEG